MIIQLNLRDKKDTSLIDFVKGVPEGELQNTLREYLSIAIKIKQIYGDDWQSMLNGRPVWASEILEKLDRLQVVRVNGSTNENEVSGDLGGLFDF